jgi:hypothetical protein
MRKPFTDELPHARPVVWEIPSFDGRTMSYGVSVRFQGRTTEVTAFATPDEAWERGVDALCNLIEGRF